MPAGTAEDAAAEYSSRSTSRCAAVRLPSSEPRHDSRWPQQVVEVGPADADDAGADLDGAQVSLGEERADEAFGDGQ
jgi:hypothetical protein